MNHVGHSEFRLLADILPTVIDSRNQKGFAFTTRKEKRKEIRVSSFLAVDPPRPSYLQIRHSIEREDTKDG